MFLRIGNCFEFGSCFRLQQRLDTQKWGFSSVGLWWAPLIRKDDSWGGEVEYLMHAPGAYSTMWTIIQWGVMTRCNLGRVDVVVR